MKVLSEHLHQPITTLLADMSAGELAFWEGVHAHEFLGSEREDYRAARVEAAIVTWAGRSLREGADPPGPLNLMPFRDQPEPDPADAVDLDAFRLRCALAARQGQEQGAELRERILREQAEAAAAG